MAIENESMAKKVKLLKNVTRYLNLVEQNSLSREDQYELYKLIQKIPNELNMKRLHNNLLKIKQTMNAEKYFMNNTRNNEKNKQIERSIKFLNGIIHKLKYKLFNEMNLLPVKKNCNNK